MGLFGSGEDESGVNGESGGVVGSSGEVSVPLDWESLFREALERDGFVCGECGASVSEGELFVVWVDDPDEHGFVVSNLVTVCEDEVLDVAWGGVVEEMRVSVGDVPSFARDGIDAVYEDEDAGGDESGENGSSSSASSGGASGSASSSAVSGSSSSSSGSAVSGSSGGRVVDSGSVYEDGGGSSSGSSSSSVSGSWGGEDVGEPVVDWAALWSVVRVPVGVVLAVLIGGSFVELGTGGGVGGVMEWWSSVFGVVSWVLGSVWGVVGLGVVSVVGVLVFRDLVSAWPEGRGVMGDEGEVGGNQFGGALVGLVVGVAGGVSVSPLVSWPLVLNVVISLVWVVGMVSCIVTLRDSVLVESLAGRESFGWVWESVVRVPVLVLVMLVFHPVSVSAWVFAGLAVVPGVVAMGYSVVRRERLRRGRVAGGSGNEKSGSVGAGW